MYFCRDFRNNNISSIDTEDWNLYSGGTSLNLANNSLENLPWNAFVGLPNLRHLDVSMNKIEEINSSVFETTPSLHEINLSYNNISVLPENLFERWHGFLFLKCLNFSYNPMSKVKFTVFKKLPALETLDLSGTRFLDMNVQSFVATQPYMTDLFLPVHIVCCTCNSTNSTTTIHKAVKRMCDQVCRDTHISCGALDNTTLYGYDGTTPDKYTNLSSSFSRTKKLNWADELDMQKLNLLRALIAKQIQERENISEEQASGNMLSTASRENKVQKQTQETTTTQAATTQAATTQMTAESKKIMVPALKQEIDLGKTPDVGSKITVVLVNGSEGENFKSNKLFPGASHKRRLQRKVNDEIKTAFVFINNTKGEFMPLAEMFPDENSQQGSNASKDMTVKPNVSILLLDTRQNTTSQLVYSRDRSGSPDWSNLKTNMSSVKVDTDHALPLIEGASDSLPPVKNRAMDIIAPVIEKPSRTKLQFNPYESDLPKADINTIAVYPSDTNDGINTMDNNITPNKSYSHSLTNYTSSSSEQTSTAAITATTEHSLTTVDELSVFISRVNTSHRNESFVADLLKLIDEIQIIVLNKTVLVSILKLIEEDCLHPNQDVACEEGVSNINMLIEQVIDNKDMEAEMNPSQYKHTRLLEAKKISDRSNLILAIAVTTAVVIIIALVCIMEILSQRSQNQDGKTPGGGRPLQRISQIFARNSSVNQQCSV
ncbi:leucine-rich repeat-containing protein 37A3-like [Acipenser ruthenus]|uniref:leucine-rich repeat-containing protein 37A3-like n=1 Tax=Acipenser ruthenus TaxID=7906 RepID=UPI0027410CC1|nr:leucine-rich repeat-containing protein 37A3-like [Acipenser ruthenus]